MAIVLLIKVLIHIKCLLLYFLFRDDVTSVLLFFLYLAEFTMASSELSLILNNANANLYPEPQHPLMCMTRTPHLSEINFHNSNTCCKFLTSLSDPS